MSIPAYVYARFSTAEQSKGHSLERQLKDGKAYVEQQGWLHDEARNIVDEGRSAFHGANREEGAALHEFEQKVRAGHFQNGAVLVVENLDRLTRQGYEQAFDLVRLFTGNGVTVATWQYNQIFKAGERIDFVDFLRAGLEADLAWKESDKKSKRLKAAWDKKYRDAEAGTRALVTGMMPAWLRKDEATGKPVAIEHRVAVLNEIYDWYCEGKGLPWIERALNQRGEPGWGRGYKQGRQGWAVDRLHRYLTTRAVLGEFEPKSRNGKDRPSRGFVLPDYYPQVISPDKFNRAQAVRQGKKGWGGKNQARLPNLFSGIARCCECQGKMMVASITWAGMVITQKRKSGNGRRSYTVKEDRGYIVCRNARRGLGCSNKTLIPYFPLERAVLEYLWDFVMRGQFIAPNSDAARLTTAVAEQERQLELKRQQVETLLDNLASVKSPALAQRVADVTETIEQDEEALRALRQELSVELGKGPPQQELEAVNAARSALQSDDPEERYAARTRVHQSLKRLINVMECQANADTMIVFGNYGAGITFNREGKRTDLSALNARYEGPDGEPDWHPDAEAAE